jgi:acyl-coenzyme A thioesterase PaaI-like protein
VRGTAHGGLIATLADIALGYNIACATGWELPIATVNLTTDYAGAAQVGDWLEARVDIQRIGRSMVFANTFIYVGDKRIARASGVFSVTQPNPGFAKGA